MNAVRLILNRLEYDGYGASSEAPSPLSFSKNTRVIAITGGKGGVGKSLTSANLGMCLASLGMRVLLVDADFGLANLDLIFGLHTRHTLDHVLSGEKSLGDIIVEGPCHVHILPSGSGLMKSMEMGKLERLKLIEAFEALENTYDIVLVDTPSGAGKHVLEWVSSCGEVLVVTTPEPTSLSDAYALMKILNKTKGTQQFDLLVNMVRTPQEGEQVYSRLSSVASDHLPIHIGYMGSISYDDVLRRSVREHKVCAQHYPFAAASSDFRLVANALVHKMAKPSSSEGLKFFSKTFLKSGVRH